MFSPVHIEYPSVIQLRREPDLSLDHCNHIVLKNDRQVRILVHRVYKRYIMQVPLTVVQQSAGCAVYLGTCRKSDPDNLPLL